MTAVTWPGKLTYAPPRSDQWAKLLARGGHAVLLNTEPQIGLVIGCAAPEDRRAVADIIVDALTHGSSPARDVQAEKIAELEALIATLRRRAELGEEMLDLIYAGTVRVEPTAPAAADPSPGEMRERAIDAALQWDRAEDGAPATTIHHRV